MFLNRFLNDDRSHQSNTASLVHRVVCFGGNLFVQTPFFEKHFNFGGFLSLPHLVDHYAKNVDERG